MSIIVGYKGCCDSSYDTKYLDYREHEDQEKRLLRFEEEKNGKGGDHLHFYNTARIRGLIVLALYYAKELLHYHSQDRLALCTTTLYYVLTMGISSNKLTLLYTLKAYMNQFG